MKNLVIALSLVVAVALGAVCVSQHNQIGRMQKQLASTQSRLQTVQTELKAKGREVEQARFARQQAELMQKALTQTAAAAQEKSKQVEHLEQSLAQVKTNSDAGAGFASFFKDPKMRQMIKSQQKLYIGPMITKEYGALFKELNLTPDQTSALKDLIEKKMLSTADAGMSMLGSDMDAAKRKELGKKIKEESDAYDEQIKQLLGDDDYQTYQDYQKSIPDRMVVGQFQDQVAGTPTALSADQEQQLIQAMTQERKNVNWTADYSNDNQNPAKMDPAKMFSEDRLNQFAQQSTQYNQLVLQRAQQILTPAQLASFKKFQSAQLEMQVNTMKLAGKMFAPQSQ